MKRVLALLLALFGSTPSLAEFRWESVRIGGGGYVTGLIIDPASPDRIYARTDVGGAYSMDRDAAEWQPLTDAIPRARRGDFSIDAFAIDPSNPQTLYLAAGMYTAEWWAAPGSILKSIDGGRTWSPPVRLAQTDGTLVKFGGNETKRQAGERIAVNPFNDKHLLVGTRHDGLFESKDAGVTFSQVVAPFRPTGGPGITSILFDRRNKGAVVLAAYGDGVYVSADAGQSWSRSDGPAKANRLTQSVSGTIWAACTSGPNGEGAFKYESGRWANVTPKSDWPASYSAVAIDPTNSSHVVVATGEADFLKLFRSLDAGSTWNELSREIKTAAPWTIDYMKRIPWTSDVKFDPQNPRRIYLTDWYGVWTVEDIEAPVIKLESRNAGLESLVIFDLLALPNGTLLTACADLGGFVHTNSETTAWPQRMADTPKQHWQDTYSMDYCRSSPQRVVRVGVKRDGGEGYWLNLSDDGGVTWRTPTSTGRPAGRLSRVAVSSTDPNTFVIVPDNQPAIVTHDGGETFAKIPTDQLPAAAFGPWYTGRPLAADPLNGNRFYYIHPDGRFFVSNDAGNTWTQSRSDQGPGKVGAGLAFSPHCIRASTVRPKSVFVANDAAGLFRSNDAGVSFQKVDSVTRPGALAIGPAGEGCEALYVWGTVNAQEGVFRSTDSGGTWQRVTTEENNLALTYVLAADPVRPDRIFAGTSGRGVFVGQSVKPRP